jgi:hypothetical protein
MFSIGIRPMNLPRFLLVKFAWWLALALLLPVAAWSQTSDIPVHPLAEKGALVFADDFATNRFGHEWTERIKSAGVENGAMYGCQTTTEHGSVATAKLDLPDGNLICECRVQFEHNVTVAFSFDDIAYADSIAGHIARVTLEQQLVKLHDDKEGAVNRKLAALKKSDDAAAKAGAEEEIKRHTLMIPMKLETQQWHTLGVEIVGDQMRVTIDGAPVGFLKSTGLAYEKKPDLKISVSGKQALFKDLRVWSVKR